MGGNPTRPLFAICFAALTIAARLPFLLTGKIPFDSDEAVEGLMARHVLNGELPAFFWGQAFKGVPEVYASAGAFAIFGSSVTILKGVTLVFFAAFVALNFILLDKVASRWLAVASSLLLIAAPPALVFWSLDASAEYVLIMLLGTTLLLLCWRFTEPGASLEGTPYLLAIGLVIGAGLWVHQLFVVYLLPLGAIVSRQGKWWKEFRPATLNRFALGLGAIAGIYITLGVIAFLSNGFSLQLGSVTISATAPQKLARIALAILVLAAIIQMASSTTSAHAHQVLRRHWPLAVGFLIGYSPVFLYSLLVEPARSPARVANLRQLVAAAPDILGNIVPILAGFKIPPTSERLHLPAIAVIPGAAALAGYLLIALRRLTADFFALFVVFFPLLFLASGAYLDTQSYRYFIPWYAGLSVAWAVGSRTLARRVRLKPRTREVRLKPDTTYRNTTYRDAAYRDTTYHDTTYHRVIATLIVCAIAGIHIWQQAAWYNKLQPDTQSLATIDCLRRHGIQGGYAEYWTAYKLTFLADERIIIAPTDGIDRYPQYTDYVKSLPERQQVRLKADTTDCRPD
jgi:hypothetical protein